MLYIGTKGVLSGFKENFLSRVDSVLCIPGPESCKGLTAESPGHLDKYAISLLGVGISGKWCA